MRAAVIVGGAALAACVDGTPPPTDPAIAVVAHEPAVDERGVAIDRLPVIVFAEDIDPATAEGAVWIEGVPGRVVVDGALVAFVPDGDLPANADLELVVDATLATTSGQDLRVPLRFAFATRDTRRAWSTPVEVGFGLSNGLAARAIGGELVIAGATEIAGSAVWSRSPARAPSIQPLDPPAFPRALSIDRNGGGLLTGTQWTPAGEKVVAFGFDAIDRMHPPLTLAEGMFPGGSAFQVLDPRSGDGMVAWGTQVVEASWYVQGQGFGATEAITRDAIVSAEAWQYGSMLDGSLAVARDVALAVTIQDDGITRVWVRGSTWEPERQRARNSARPPVLALQPDGHGVVATIVGDARVDLAERRPDGTWAQPRVMFDAGTEPPLSCAGLRAIALQSGGFAISWHCVASKDDEREGHFVMVRGADGVWSELREIWPDDGPSNSAWGGTQLEADIAGRVVYGASMEDGVILFVDGENAGTLLPRHYGFVSLDVSPSGAAIATFDRWPEGGVPTLVYAVLE